MLKSPSVTSPANGESVQPGEVQSWLEWAGERLLALPVHGTRPSGHRVYWPEFPPDPNVAYGYNNLRLRPPAPGKAEIPIIDEIYELVALVPEVRARQLLQARSLIVPLNKRYLNSWTKLAALLHTDRRSVKRIHQGGLCVICDKVADASVARFREFVN
jgi:hypothetical protein